MEEPDWGDQIRCRSLEMGDSDPPQRQRRTWSCRRGCAALIAVAVGVLPALGYVPNWGGRDPRDLSVAETEDTLNSPLPTEPKRRTALTVPFDMARDGLQLLREVAAEDSPAGRDARRLLERLRPLTDPIEPK